MPITWAEHVGAQGHWGNALREYMADYVHWSCLGALCEFLPQPDNRVTLAAEKDRHGLPVARFSYTQCDNDRQLMRAAQDVMEQILHAAGADEVITIDRYAHLVGGARKARLLGTAVTALLGSAGPAAELAAAHGLEVSGHCAPNLHARAAAGVGQASQHEAVNEHESDRAV